VAMAVVGSGVAVKICYFVAMKAEWRGGVH
jgi:hypothetical protein